MTKFLKNKNHQSRGFLWILIAVAAMAFILILAFIMASVMIGDRTGAGSGTESTDSSGGDDSTTTPAGKGSGICTGDSVKSEPIRDSSVDGVAVSVPIWKYKSQTDKQASTMTLRVNRNCTTQIKNIFQKAYNSADKPPIKTSDTGCYAPRPNNTSMHNWGGACDINWTENYCVMKSGSLCGPAGWWRPETDVLSIPIVSSISSAFASEGWSRGLWSKKLDYMHYSVNGQ